MTLTIEPSICIWCTELRQGNEEHIIPEALGCPSWYVLKRGVCTACNSANGTLDNALLKVFEPITFLLGMKRKGGKSATIVNHSTIAGYHNETGPHLFINRENYAVEIPSGKKLGKTSKQDPIQNFSHAFLANNRVQTTFDYRLFFNRNAVRGLFKIALEAVAYQVGLDFVQGTQFNPIRDFVRSNVGDFRALQVVDSRINIVADEIHLSADLGDDGTGVVAFDVIGNRFICDFAASFRNGINTIACGVCTSERYVTLPNI